MSTYPKIMQATRSLPGYVNIAYRNDLTEMYLTMAASAGLVPLPGMAAAMGAAARLAGARAQCEAAIQRINNVTAGWLSASSRSLELLADNKAQWDSLVARAREIGGEMESLLDQSRGNSWEGVAHNQKDDFHTEQVKTHQEFTNHVVKVPQTLQLSGTVTRMLFTLIYAPLRATQAKAVGIAVRFPLPRPSGFGLCTRTPMLAQELMALALHLEQQRFGGPWRTAEGALSSNLNEVGTHLQETRRSRRRRRGGSHG